MKPELEPLVFRQDPGLKSEEIILFSDRLLVVVRGMGLSEKKEIQLSEIDPKPERIRRRFWPLYMVPLIYGCLIIITSRQLEMHAIISHNCSIVGYSLSLLFVWHLIVGLRPIEVTRFRDRDGALLFEVCRPRRSVWIYTEFLDVLTRRIEFA